MRAAVLHGREDVRIEEVPIPDVGPGEVRVRICAALTCGTDVKVFRRGYHARMIAPPAIFGHEFAGVVDAVGQGAASWRPGMRVVAANSAPCGRCFFCARNQEELCEDLLFLNGAYAEHITIPARLVRTNLVEIPDHLPFEAAALAEPLACVVHGMEDSYVRSGDTIAVVGTGPIGLFFVLLCKLAGARVIAVGRSMSRLEAARSMGADEIISSQSDADVVQSVRERTEGGRGADRVVECVGKPEVWEQAIAMARKGGLVNLFGGCENDTSIRVDTSRIHYDELTVKGSFHHTPRAVRAALDLLTSGAIDGSAFVQREAPLSDLPDVLRSLQGANASVKVAIHP